MAQDNTSPSSTPCTSPDSVVLAGGCFWGTEHFLKQISGVISTQVGYVNSSVPNPTYRQVCHGDTHAAEGVKVTYDPRRVDLPFLLSLYFMTIDPTSVNRQGGDQGPQYRTGIYYQTPEQERQARASLEKLSHEYDRPLAVEVEPLRNFYPAEDYHQDYLDKNPGGYCHVDPRLFEIARKARRYARPSDDSLRRSLTPMQWEVTQNAATERPFTGEYTDEHRKGIYVDVTTGEPLFLSTDKFDSGCGWPAFSRPVSEDATAYRRDTSHGMERVEVRSRQGDAHLGHVFRDGPRSSGGLRYCINSAALRFVPLEDMERQGYGEYVNRVK